jgi:hypothetical protein
MSLRTFIVALLIALSLLGVASYVSAAFPTAAAPTITTISTSLTGMNVNMPSTVNAGDLLLAFVEVPNAGSWTLPTDWVELGSQLGGGSVGELTVFYKIADGTEDSTTPTFTASTGSTASWQVIRVTDWHGTTPPEMATASGDVSAADPASLTPSWGSADTLWIAAAGHTAASNAAWSAGPSGYDGFTQSGASSGGSAVSLATAWETVASSTENPGAYTVSGSNRWWAAATVAVRPAGPLAPSTNPPNATLRGTGGLQMSGGIMMQ